MDTQWVREYPDQVVRIDRKALNAFVKGCYDDGASKQLILDAVSDIYDLIQKWDTCSKGDALVGQEFNLDSGSWQVEEVNANGHYIVEK